MLRPAYRARATVKALLKRLLVFSASFLVTGYTACLERQLTRTALLGFREKLKRGGRVLGQSPCILGRTMSPRAGRKACIEERSLKNLGNCLVSRSSDRSLIRCTMLLGGSLLVEVVVLMTENSRPLLQEFIVAQVLLMRVVLRRLL